MILKLKGVIPVRQMFLRKRKAVMQQRPYWKGNSDAVLYTG